MDMVDIYEKVFEDLIRDYCDCNGIFLDRKERERLVHDIMYNSPGMWEVINDTIATRVDRLKEDE